MPAPRPAAARAGSRGHEYQDALTYAQWGVDYLKYDWCGCEDLNAKGAYTTMRDALHAAGRPMVFSMCEWGRTSRGSGRQTSAISGARPADIYPAFDGRMLDHTNWQQWGVLQILDAQEDRCATMPAPATGTIPTCWKSATA